MKKKSWFLYLVYGLIFIFYFIGGNWLLTLLNKNSEASFNPIPFIIWSTVIFIILGILLGLENLLLEARKEGKWHVNLPRVIFMGIPLLYFSLSFFIYYCPIPFLRQTLSYPVQAILYSKMAQTYLSVFQVMLGYVVITSLYKVRDI